MSNRICRSGVAIYLVVIVIAILSLGAFALFSIITTERHATTIRGDEIQVRAAAESGVEFVRMVSAMNELERARLDGIENNPNIFAGVEVQSVVRNQRRSTFRFTIVSPNIVDGRLLGVRYGLQNESAKLHLETVLQWELESPGQGRQALLALPRMNPGTAESILDWIDADDTPRSSGAELDYYRRIGVPYGPKNAIPVSLDELLLVRDVNRSLLFGTDADFSFGFSLASSNKPDSNSQSEALNFRPAIPVPEIPTADLEALDTTFPAPEIPLQPDDEFPLTDTLVPSLSEISAEPVTASPRFPAQSEAGGLPWVHYLTTLSAEKEVNPQGIAKYDLNDSNLEFLQTQIGRTVDEQAAEFVIQLRQGGLLETPIDLLTAEIPAMANPFDLKSPEGKTRFYKLLDYGTTSRDVVITGRININEAPGEVLRAVPELTDEVVSQIVSRRRTLSRDDLRHPVWLFAEELVDATQMQSLWKRITTGGSVYRFQVIGFADNQGTASRFEVVIDATVRPPRQVFFKDLTMYGGGFPRVVLRPNQE